MAGKIRKNFTRKGSSYKSYKILENNEGEKREREKREKEKIFLLKATLKNKKHQNLKLSDLYKNH